MACGMPLTVAILFLLAIGGSSPGFARFDPEDIRQVDVEHEFTTEAYNDKVSYAPPLRWRRLWRTSQNGFMMSAGSLSQTRFDYREDIKLHAKTETPLHLSFTRQKFEDAVDQTMEQELRLGWQVGDATRISMMGDGDSVKEFADIGGAITQEVASETFVEAFYWSVDHYYGLKKPFAMDRRSRDTYTAGLKIDFQPTQPTHASLQVSYDHPLRWHLGSEGYVYEYERRHALWEVELVGEHEEGWRLSGHAEQKAEGKSWYDVPGSHKNLKRTVWFHELERYFLWDGRVSSVGVMGVWRRASYEQNHLDLLPLNFVNFDYEKSAVSERREVGSYARSSWPVSSNGRHHFEGGVYANAARLAEASVHQRAEVKVQTAWEYLASERTRLFMNVSWDVDEVAEALYEKRGIRAWGGGNFQVMAVF